MSTPSESSQSITKKEVIANTIIKYQEVTEEILVDDRFVDSDVQLLERITKLIELRSFLTQFDGSQYSNKVKEEGVEHSWTTADSTVIKTGLWESRFEGKFYSTKEITYRETDRSKT